MQPQDARFLCGQCGGGRLRSDHYYRSLRGAHFPSPSCLSVHFLSYGSQPSSQFKALLRPALCIDRESLWIWPLRSMSAGRKRSWRWPRAFILASSKPDLPLLEQCLTHGAGLSELFVFPFCCWLKLLAGRVLGLSPAIQLGGLCAISRLSGGQYIGPGFCLGLQPLLMCTDNVGLSPTPPCSQSPAREGPSRRKCAFCFLSAKCLLSDFHLGAFAEPAGTDAVWRRHAWKTHQCHSGLFSSPLQVFSHGVGLSATTGEQSGDCSLAFWWAPVSGRLQVLCGYWHLFLPCPEHGWHWSQLMDEETEALGIRS